MTRKRKSVRLQEARDLLNIYESRGLHYGSGQYSFIRDMIRRLESERALSKKQREWLDKLIAHGPPEIKNIDYFNRLRKIADHEMIPGFYRNAASDMSRVAAKYDLSDKQINFLEKMENEMIAIEKAGPFKPSSQQIFEAFVSIVCSQNRSGTWWSYNQGYAKAAASFFKWVASHSQEKTCFIDEWTMKKLALKDNHPAKVYASKLSSGSIGYLKVGFYVAKLGRGEPVLITSDPYITICQSTEASVHYENILGLLNEDHVEQLSKLVQDRHTNDALTYSGSSATFYCDALIGGTHHTVSCKAISRRAIRKNKN